MTIDTYNKRGLIKLTERYLAKTVLQYELIAFLEQKISNIRSISKEVASISGKNINSIYKNKNELEVYNAISLMRYWHATIQLCKKYSIPEADRPNFEKILSKYQSTLDFIAIITAEDELDSLISNNLSEILKLINFYQQHPPKSKNEIATLNQLINNKSVQREIVLQTQKKKSAQLERMKRK